MLVKSSRYALLFLLPISLLFKLDVHASDKSHPVLTDSEILNVIKNRIDIEKKGVGLVVGVIDDQGSRVITYGVADKTSKIKVDGDSIFEIGSVTKLFTSLLLADMVEKGELKLTDPVAMYLPQDLKMPTRSGKQITLIDLANHISGLPQWPDNMPMKDPLNPAADYTVAQMYEFLSRFQLTRDIGEKEEYSNIGVGLLGHALSLRAGKDFDTLVKERITQPLKMEETSVAMTPKMKAHLASPHNPEGERVKNWDLPAIPGAGALHSSVNDMLKFLAANMHPEKTPMARAIQGMQKPFPDTPATHLAWSVYSKYGITIFKHSGSTYGYKSIVLFDQSGRRGIVILSNSGDVVDLGHHFIHRSWRLMQYTPPSEFVQKLNQKGYGSALEIYNEMKQNDAEFYLREAVVNEWAYTLLGKNEDAQAIEIFKLGIHLFPKSANAYDSLAEAYEKVGDQVNAILQYKKCLELEPNSPHALERLSLLVKP